jgi:hypothetical protein
MYSIASRHIQSFLFFIALPVLLIMIISGVLFRRQIINMTYFQQEAALRQYASGIDMELQSMSIMASSLIHNRTLRNYAQEYVHTESAEQRYLLSAEIEQILNTYSLIFRGLIGFYAILSDESQPIISRNYSGINLSSGDIKTYTEMADANRGFIIFPDDLKFSFDNKDEMQIVSLAVSASADPGYTDGIKTLLVSFVANQLMDFIRQNHREINATQYISDSFLVG